MKNIKKEYMILGFILFFSAFFRLFRLNQLLGFWYDQGRDALVIRELIHAGKFFLIGPVTGIDGIYLGPFYYYLLTPFYWLGKGNPVFPAAFLALLNVGAGFLLYYLGKKIFNSTIGLIAAFLWGFSYNQVTFSRWLANPTPLPFFALLSILYLYKFIETHNSKPTSAKASAGTFLILNSFLIGLCLQLEAAAAVFFIPSIIVILIWQRKVLSVRYLVLSIIVFILTLAPQIYFNFRHDGILFSAFNKFLFEEKSFKLSIETIPKSRLLTYYDVFAGRLFPSLNILGVSVLASFSAGFFIFRKKLLAGGGKLLFIWLFVPLIGYFFYQGNNGYIWDYYFGGLTPAFILLFSAVLFFLFRKNFLWKIIVLSMMIVFLSTNLKFLYRYLQTGIGITLGAQKKAIDWIYTDAGKEKFNADFYVPPKIFYSYTYLLKWYGKGKFGREPETKMVKNLYTLSEPDGEHPYFLQAWLERQDGIGKIVKDYSWGSIAVQRRERLKYE